MRRESHVRFCEHLGGRFPGVTRPVAESFFATIKKELIHKYKFTTRREAAAAIFEYIEAFYNRVRKHSKLGYTSPVDFKRDNQSAATNPAA